MSSGPELRSVEGTVGAGSVGAGEERPAPGPLGSGGARRGAGWRPGRGSALVVVRLMWWGLGAVCWWALWPMVCAAVAWSGWSRLLAAVTALVCRWRVQLGAAVLGVCGCAALGVATVRPAGVVLTGVGLLVAAVPVVRGLYPHTRRGLVRTRYGRDGWAGWWDLHRAVSPQAVRRAAVASRPSLAATVSLPPTRPGAAARPVPGRVARLPLSGCGTWLGRSVVGPVRGTECYAAHRDVVGLIAPPQTGKTALIGHHVIDHCGPVLATSTKTDLYDLCAGRRARRAAVALFNPENLGGLGSSVWWSPVTGCADSQVATERAGHLVAATATGDDGDGDRWAQWAAGVLRALLLAAALHDRDMRSVAHWVFNPTSDARRGGAAEALTLLHAAPPGTVPPGAADALAQVLGTDARKTRDSIFLTLRRAVEFMTDPQVAALVTPTAGVPEFDASAFVTGQGAVFVMGSDRPHACVAPLLAALTGHVFETAKRVAAALPQGRLDPPLGLFLDEAALIVPVPLDRWVADAGGRGIHIEWAVQSPSQLAQRWGTRGKDTIWNATNTKLVYGGLSLGET